MQLIETQLLWLLFQNLNAGQLQYLYMEKIFGRWRISIFLFSTFLVSFFSFFVLVSPFYGLAILFVDVNVVVVTKIFSSIEFESVIYKI